MLTLESISDLVELDLFLFEITFHLVERRTHLDDLVSMIPDPSLRLRLSVRILLPNLTSARI